MWVKEDVLRPLLLWNPLAVAFPKNLILCLELLEFFHSCRYKRPKPNFFPVTWDRISSYINVHSAPISPVPFSIFPNIFVLFNQFNRLYKNPQNNISHKRIYEQNSCRIVEEKNKILRRSRFPGFNLNNFKIEMFINFITVYKYQ